MTFSLYDAVIPSNLQILGAVDAFVAKGEAYAQEKGMAPEALLKARLAPDMLPFGYQVKSCAVHSIGAIEGVRGGSFTPDMKPWPDSFARLRAAVRDARAALEGIAREEFDALAERDVTFRMGDLALPFTGGQFLLSFSQPNFYFHATTAYAILRAQGVPLGKKDFIGRLRIRR